MPPPPSPTTTTDTTTSGMGSSGSIKDVDEKTPGTVYGYEKAKLLQKICLENKRMYAELHPTSYRRNTIFLLKLSLQGY